MDWMARHAALRADPERLFPGVRSVVCVRMDYLRADATPPRALQQRPRTAHLSRYAVGRDYHKLMRRRLALLAQRLEAAAGGRHRAFVDSAPVLERAYAERAGLGWIGKHTNLLHREAGNWFFLGELYTTLALPRDAPAENHCGSCRRCIDVCPTGAITAPYRLDARRCIAYLTIELDGAIPVEFRAAIGNHVFGCDDCLAVCPWNKFATPSDVEDFSPRRDLDAPDLVALFDWDEATFLARTEGTALRRIGHRRWLRNLAVALGNAPHSLEVVEALRRRQAHPSAMVREHVAWALARHQASP
jgi:epoxyqueuosine reductase